MSKKLEAEPIHMPERYSYFSSLMIIFSLILIVVGIVNWLSLAIIPSIVSNVLLILSGLWILKTSIEKGFSKQHKEILKRYI